MYVKIHSNKDYIGGNAESCRDLVEYLDKENLEKGFDQKEYFFNDRQAQVTDQRVIQDLDSNHKGLKKSDAKFFMVTINPSQAELNHLARQVTGRNIQEISEMNPTQLEEYNRLFKEYVNECMQEYARAFNRDISRDDILYYAKVEQERTYKGHEPEVRDGKVKSGEKKTGLQTHSHVVISRMDRGQKMSLSPRANSRGKSEKHKLNGNSVKVGFDRSGFKTACEKQFDQQFNYKRDYRHSYEYYNSKKFAPAMHAFKNHITYKYVLQNIKPEASDIEKAASQILHTYRLLNKVPSVKNFIREGLKQMGKGISAGLEM